MATIVFYSNDMVFPSRVAAYAAQTGVTLSIAPVPSSFARQLGLDTRLALIDLSMGDLDLPALVQQVAAASPEAKCLGFGPHVDEALLSSAKNAGFAMVLTRGQFQQSFPMILAQLAAQAPSN